MPAPVLAVVAHVFHDAGIDLVALGHAWARVLPIVVIVPAFGLRALPPAARAVIGLALAAAIAPSLGLAGATAGGLANDIARGLSVALAAAVPLWAATMAGGVVDAVRGAPDLGAAPVVEGRATGLGVPLSILASAIFLAGGGAARVVSAVSHAGGTADPIVLAARDLSDGITLAVALGAPVLVASIVVEAGAALLTRASNPALTSAFLAPLRALVVLAVLAVSVDRVAEGLALAMR